MPVKVRVPSFLPKLLFTNWILSTEPDPSLIKASPLEVPIGSYSLIPLK